MSALEHKTLTYSVGWGAATQKVRRDVDTDKVIISERWKSFEASKKFIDPSSL